MCSLTGRTLRNSTCEGYKWIKNGAMIISREKMEIYPVPYRIKDI
jgi:hypothetical protein